MKVLLTGNEAVARGAFEAGVTYASAYPGTPSTEILENMIEYKEDLIAEWAPNEKVALESVIGASMAGARTLAAMKHVGVNVAADPLFTIGYTGITGGLVLVSADDPGCHSSQNEQDNRYYAKFAKIAMLEPSDSEESKEYVKAAFEISEKFDVPVLFRMTTRVCHSKGLVELGERKNVEIIPYKKQPQKFISAPAHAKMLHPIVEDKLVRLEQFSNETELNRIEWGSKKIGIITSGVAYNYAKEVFGDDASYLKLGFTFPLPMDKIRAFSKEVETLYVIEELEPFIEEQMKAAGISCIGKEKISRIGELNPDIVAKALLGIEKETVKPDPDQIVGRPPTLCAGCPHRGFFFALSKKKNVVITGDIGCYTLGSAEPLNATDSVICMGASISMGHGASKAFAKNNVDKKVVAVIGDSTFFHTGVNSLIHVAYNKGNTVSVILDNRITGMTGHQENPGTGFSLQGDPANMINIPDLVKAIGIEHVVTVNPLKLKEVESALDEAFAFDGPSVIITRWPCVLKNFSEADIKEFDLSKKQCHVIEDKCKGCRVCTKTGCPAISFDNKTKKAKIDKYMCVGCEVCLQACPFKAIERVGE
ncbi:indolepyruvate ferredoxin oxidoreductase subunit alpha [Fusibacter bizertensis]|jgi:indolepyruvate ferredoxin oxidoreductase, alpha subunit|uniref:Indolepyruvate oxidoreductase subunit IorA n=1 Tax=Fusibacter bizertensis TaxID=1488331 RepID=A0ABT6NAV5_9FIRM|nr:indolepyruvate ferredoxin oxidoreductase subunit alpha [Fusibacter bizertensis]MDH8677548.1 indolepyruvate ferredoxin oxidoreductase subunit alpha [Fusibacter bizertensis]